MPEPRLPDLTRSFERHLRAENKSDRTVDTYLRPSGLLKAFLASRGVGRVEADRAHIEALLFGNEFCLIRDGLASVRAMTAQKYAFRCGPGSHGSDGSPLSS
jgi:hypothetical protein